MPSARDTIAGRGPGRATGDPALAPVANAPWAPAETVYLHEGAPLVEDDEPADFDVAQTRAPSRVRRTIPLLWAAVLTIAALQHAGEVERRAGLREPSPAELQIQARAEREIRAVWRSVGTIADVQQAEPSNKQEPVSGPVLALGDPQDQTEAGAEEPIADGAPASANAAAQASSGVTAGDTGATAEGASQKTEAIAAREQAEITTAHTTPALVEEPVGAKQTLKPDVAAAHRRQLTKRGAARARTSAAAPLYAYTESGGQFSRYLTIERVGRAAP